MQVMKKLLQGHAMRVTIVNIRLVIRQLGCFAVIITSSCQEKPSNLHWNDEGLSDPLILTRVVPGDRGVVGDYSFYQKYTDFFEDEVDAVGGLFVYDEVGSIVARGSGIHLSDAKTDREMILTAAHLIYDSSSNQRIGDQFYFGSETDGQPPIRQSITNFPDQRETPHTDDWLLIPIYKKEGRTPLIIDPQPNQFNLSAKIENEYPGYFVSISAIKGNTSDQIKIIQRAEDLYLLQYPPTLKVVTSLDTLLGMSGSPVFYVNDGQMLLIGVQSKRGGIKNCEDAKKFGCGNQVAVIPVVSVPNQQ